MARKVYYFREFRCPDDHITHRMVEAGEEWVSCTSPGCKFAATRPTIMAGLSAAVHGDEIDYIDHNLGKDPIHIRSKAERRRLMAERGLEEFIRHTPVPGSDRSPYTSDWSKGSMDPKTLANAQELINRVHGGQAPIVEVEEPAPVANPFNFVAENADMAKVTAIVDPQPKLPTITSLDFDFGAH